jgi:hypothetical protein
MKDRFEEFIRDHREEFDMFEPRPELWKGIEKSIKPQRTIRWTYYLSRAAVVLVIVGASLIGQRLWLKNGKGPADTMADTEVNIPELKEAEMYYSGMINAKMEEMKPYLSEYPSLEDELNTDLNELDSIYISLKNDLKDNIANHEVIEAMIQNYRLRISILEDMLHFLASQNNEEEDTINTERI